METTTISPLERASLEIMDRCEPSSHRWAEEVVRLVMHALREPIDAWLSHQIEHGCAPGGYALETTPEYNLGRQSAFAATQAMINAAFSE